MVRKTLFHPSAGGREDQEFKRHGGMKYFKDLTEERWFRFSFDQQMSNVGSEISRSIKWRGRDEKMSRAYFEMGMELFDATIADSKNQDKKERLLKNREELMNYFSRKEFSHSNDRQWSDYFYTFNYAVAVNRGV